MKKRIALLLVLGLISIMVMGACSGSGTSGGGSGTTGGGSAEVANPWSDVDSAAAAAEGAGIEGFDLAEGIELSLGKVEPEGYRYMEGVAQADIPIAAVEMTIRKGLASAVTEEGDISGDYNTYKYSWTQNIKGLEVTCFGNREGEATKTIWQSGDYCYSITAYGAGGDSDFGLSADDLNSLVNGLQ